MSIWTDKDGRRHVAVTVNGRRTHRRLPAGATARDAKQFEAHLLATLSATGRSIVPGDPPLLDVLAAYMEAAPQRLRSPDTALHHARRIVPWVQQYPASQADACAAHIVRDMQGRYKPATINRSLGILKAALTLAWRERRTPENHGRRIQRLPEHNERHSYPSVETVQAIAAHCSPSAQAAIWMALLTGARRAEVCRIDPAKHVKGDRLEIPASHTKTQRTRSLPIIAPMRLWLPYFPLRLTVAGLNSAFRRARVKAGYPTVRFHDLRHACASLLIAAGEDLYTVGEILGHTAVQTTRRYAHLQLEKKRTALTRLGDEVSAQIAPEIAPAKKKLRCL